MSDRSPTQFLDLKTYRLKRLVDAAKMLPLLGAVLLLFPLPFLFLPSGEGHNALPLGIYLLSVWIGLIAFAAAFARKLRDPTDQP
jgi:hypothetical protein